MLQLNSVIYVVLMALKFSQLGNTLQEQGILFRDDDVSNSQSGKLTDTGCNTLNGIRGECISILHCPALLSLIYKPDGRKFLTKSWCGWEFDTPLVCCGIEPPVSAKRNCNAADLHWCSMDKLDECCIPDLTYNTDEVTSTASSVIEPRTIDFCNMSVNPPEPSSKCCGEEATQLKIIPGEVTRIDQYPWTAIIEYTSIVNSTIEIQCGGALISGRYVLTAAHCLFIDNWIPLNIRLGDYNIDHPGMDCVEEASGGTDCTNGEVTIPIEEKISHPDYIVKSRAQTNDIALVKLQHNAPYTDYIRPICLPSMSSDFTKMADSTAKLYVAGWGVMRNTQSRSQLRRQMELPFVKDENCFTIFRRLNVVLGEGQICTGGERGQNSCKGDSGGALMLLKDYKAEIVGITSFSSCGRTNRPAVYTKVLHYLPWISSIIN